MCSSHCTGSNKYCKVSLLQVKQTQLDREQVARDIAEKLGYAPGISYSEIAMKAADCGRMQLAIKVGFV